MSTGGLICIMMLTGYFWTIGMISAVILEPRLSLFHNKIYMKQTNKKEIGRNIIEPTANKREKLKSLRENLKLFLIKSMNGREKVKIDKTGVISFKTFPNAVENIELFKTMYKKVQNKIVKFVPLVSTSAEKDLKELEEIMKQL